jgi:hypothetical protein
MKLRLLLAAIVAVVVTGSLALCADPSAVPLPNGVRPVWNLNDAYHETTPTRERICINGLWRWRPAKDQADVVPADKWGYFKVPGAWPGATYWMQRDCQTLYAHPSWKKEKLTAITAAWYQREITIPSQWTGRRVTLAVEYLNSYAVVFVDNKKKVGDIHFPGGEVDLTSACQPGSKHLLSMLVVAMPLRAVMLSYSDTASARAVKGTVTWRGLCGDVYLVGTPPGARIVDVRTATSVRKGQITFDAALVDLSADARYALQARITDRGRQVAEFTSKEFGADELQDGRISMNENWMPDRLWDLHTPGNVYQVSLSLLDAKGKLLDTAPPERFGFRELCINGRDLFLNGTRVFLSCVPLDNAQVGAMTATYEAAKESLLRLKGIGVNCVYTHNYGCEPGSHMSFAEILRAADDVGMLVSFSQPHFGHYQWRKPDADGNNGYARHAEFYVRAAGNHPSVVFYAMSHNGTGYTEDMNPDLIDGRHDRRDLWAERNAKLALRAEAIVKRLDPSRIVYHHASGNLGSMHTSNFYPNFAPAQELSDWFEHWATHGVKPLFPCEYGAPMSWDWTSYRGWYQGTKCYGGAKIPWEFCLAEWNAQFLGDRAFQLGGAEQADVRWEAAQNRAGRLWHRYDYPYVVGSPLLGNWCTVIAGYIADNWRAQRTWGVSMLNAQWEFGNFWKLGDGAAKGRVQFKTDWDKLQRPGFSPDYIQSRYPRMDLAFQRSDWIATPAAESLLRYNQPLLAYLAGKPAKFTSKDHNFYPGETVEKQIIVINNSRETVTCDCRCSFDLPDARVARAPSRVSSGLVPGPGWLGHISKQFSLPTGEQRRVPLRFTLPKTLTPGEYRLNMTAEFNKGQPQQDSLLIHVLLPVRPPKVSTRIAVFDPKGETVRLLGRLGLQADAVEAGDDLSRYDLLVIGKAALTVGGPSPNVDRVRDGLKVIVFEQSAEVLEKRCGFRVLEYGLRQVFRRVPDHPLLAELPAENLRDWRGEATLLPPRLTYETRPGYGPTIRWCDIPVTRVWRCGNYGNVASVLIEKPAVGDFLPVVDGGFSLQYSPLMEYHEGRGMVLFCQMDVTGRSENDPAAERLARNILRYVSAWQPSLQRTALYVGEPAGKSHLARAGVSAAPYDGGNLTFDHVLVVGPGGGTQLSAIAARLPDWLKAGGTVLAIGLDENETRALLPFHVTVKKAEHVWAYFQPFGVDSLLAGIGPADVYNRDPRELPLISAGALVIGDGVLAKAEQANVVFFQLVPWKFDYKQHYNLKRTFRRTSFVLSRLLAGMGVSSSTPLLMRLSTPVVATRRETRWRDGLYVDQPEEWDDPYRFFRW